MDNFFTIVLLTLFLICIDANDKTAPLSDPMNQTMNSVQAKMAHSIPFKKRHAGLLWERMTVIVTISSVSIGIMIVIVVIYITAQYMRNRRIESAESADQQIPMHTERIPFNADASMPRHGKRRWTRATARPCFSNDFFRYVPLCLRLLLLCKETLIRYSRECVWCWSRSFRDVLYLLVSVKSGSDTESVE